jgi:hypothetical protein
VARPADLEWESPAFAGLSFSRPVKPDSSSELRDLAQPCGFFPGGREGGAPGLSDAEPALNS